MTLSNTTIRITERVYLLLSDRAKAENRSISGMATLLLSQALEPDHSTRAAVLEVRRPTVPNGTREVSLDARTLVHEHVPRYLLSNSRVRDGLYQQVQQMADDGLDPRGIALSLEEWTNRPNAYPGHLPHIYSELARRQASSERTPMGHNGTRPASKVDQAVVDLLAMADRYEQEGG